MLSSSTSLNNIYSSSESRSIAGRIEKYIMKNPPSSFDPRFAEASARQVNSGLRRVLQVVTKS
jgi:hypothetical protein